jgi:hypothetical protein
VPCQQENVLAIEMLDAREHFLMKFLVEEKRRLSLGCLLLPQVLDLLDPLQKHHKVVVPALFIKNSYCSFAMEV